MADTRMAMYGNGNNNRYNGGANHNRQNCRPKEEPKKSAGTNGLDEKRARALSIAERPLDQQGDLPVPSGASLMGSAAKKRPLRGGIAEEPGTGKQRSQGGPYGFEGARRSFKLTETKRREANNDIRETTGRGRNR